MPDPDYKDLKLCFAIKKALTAKQQILLLEKEKTWLLTLFAAIEKKLCSNLCPLHMLI